MKKLSTLFLLLAFFGTLSAQTKSAPQKPVSAQESAAVLLGRTAPLRELTERLATTPEQKGKIKATRPPRNFVGRGMPYDVNPNSLPQGIDKTRQSTQGKNNLTDIDLLSNIEGLSSRFSPNDPSGDIGREYYIQAVNVTRFQIFFKDGTPASQPIAANTLWEEIDRFSAGDPIVLYDQTAERWIITEFPSGNELLFAITETPDPFGNWMIYSFGTPNFPDYPKYGVWDDAYVVTTNEEGSANQTNYFINREAILSGAAEAPIQRILVPGFENGPGFYVGTPVDWSGFTQPLTKPMMVRPVDDAWSTLAIDAVDVLEFDIDWEDEENSTFELTRVETAPFDLDFCSVSGSGFECVPSMGTLGIDGIPAVIMNQVHYQNFGSHESMVLNFATDATAGNNVGGIRWMELRKDAENVDWYVYQEGTFSLDDGLDRFMGAIAMDHDGNIAIAYSTSSENTFPSLRMTGRLAGDTLGRMTFPEQIIHSGTRRINGNGRFGDYAQMAVDPYNGRTFWFTSEYGAPNRVATRIASFNLAKDSLDFAGEALITPVSSAESTNVEQVTIAIRNAGLQARTGFTVGYVFNGGAPVTEEVPDITLQPDSIYFHTFVQGVDMAAVGDYDLKVFSDLDGDEFTANDTLRTTRRTIPKSDVAVRSLRNLPIIICDDSISIDVTIVNRAGRPLEQATINVRVNGELNATVNFDGSLATNAAGVISIPVTGLENGEQTLEVEVTNPNGLADELPADNITRSIITVNTEAVDFTVDISLDFYSYENSWQVLDEEGAVVASSNGPYPFFGGPRTVSETICLPPNECYTFVLFDSFGDGLEGGGFVITDQNGEEIASAGPDFFVTQQAAFCAFPACTIGFEASASPAGGENERDGVIMIALNGTDGADIQTSLNGGPLSDTLVYDSLAPGAYTVLVTNGTNCNLSETVLVDACTLAATATVTDDTIHVDVTNGVGPYTYSIDNDSFQLEPQFVGLDTGDVTVYVGDSLGCTLSLDVRVELSTDVYFAESGQKVVLYPNPTEGVFKIEVSGLSTSEVFLPIQIFDAGGRLVQSGKVVRYDNAYYGHFSILSLPAGMYYLRVNSPDLKRLLRIVKR